MHHCPMHRQDVSVQFPYITSGIPRTALCHLQDHVAACPKQHVELHALLLASLLLAAAEIWLTAEGSRRRIFGNAVQYGASSAHVVHAGGIHLNGDMKIFTDSFGHSHAGF